MSERGLARLFLSLSLSLSGSLPCPLPFAFSSLLTLPSQSDDNVPLLHSPPCLIRIGYVSVVLQPSFHTPTARWFQRRLCGARYCTCSFKGVAGCVHVQETTQSHECSSEIAVDAAVKLLSKHVLCNRSETVQVCMN